MTPRDPFWLGVAFLVLFAAVLVLVGYYHG